MYNYPYAGGTYVKLVPNHEEVTESFYPEPDIGCERLEDGWNGRETFW